MSKPRRSPFVIAVTGKSGSGKTALADRLAAALVERFPGKSVSILPLDSYYRDLGHLSLEQRSSVDFDHPGSWDWPLLTAHLADLARGRAVNRPVYLFDRHTRGHDTVRTESADFLILEGLFSFEARIEDQVHFRIFIDLEDRTAFRRRLARDLVERGRDPESVEKQYFGVAVPAFLRWVGPLKCRADAVVRGDGPIDRLAADLAQRIGAAVGLAG